MSAAEKPLCIDVAAASARRPPSYEFARNSKTQTSLSAKRACLGSQTKHYCGDLICHQQNRFGDRVPRRNFDERRDFHKTPQNHVEISL